MKGRGKRVAARVTGGEPVSFSTGHFIPGSNLGFVSDYPHMIERHLFVLKYMYETPILATCERCHFRFFTSLEMFDQPVEALENLWRKFNSHICKPVSFSHKHAVRGVA